jgi:hypothetical protein
MCSDAFVHLDEASVRAGHAAPCRSARCQERRSHQSHPQPVHVDSVAGQPLTPAATRRLFETEVSASRALRGCGRRRSARSLACGDERTLEADPSLTMIASRQRRVRAACARGAAVPGRRRIPPEPLYVEAGSPGAADTLTFRLRFPSDDYEQGTARAGGTFPGSHDRPPRLAAVAEGASMSSPTWCAAASSSTCRNGITRFRVQGSGFRVRNFQTLNSEPS